MATRLDPSKFTTVIWFPGPCGLRSPTKRLQLQPHGLQVMALNPRLYRQKFGRFNPLALAACKVPLQKGLAAVL